ncbi:MULTISPECIES: hypothetical protein [unclassified Bradyrhizobium]|uniref:hypothetical protein n=1 Tax=unclassified Bradyrhizobium TaxID=2631580 RepID=UPI001FFAF9EE|nr:MULTISPECIES: hypothetical protein [unclassified Bradyrhizobium]MCK1309870.1 hypothetical protein [Bradyrhizobium sp. 45]MCK1435382.1 hypothetical protein [Bradyrhizobium sp. 15]MCK1614915.1 hypothetical protein [Bradyrhizobium sp. 163]MCK1760225.1 hypothetical protein [Bradyrhizobium sp. 136]
MRGTALTPAQHYLFLRHNPICAGHGRLNAIGLTWTYRVRPTLLSREYEVCITFRPDDSPRVFVVSPSLTELAGGRKLPHVYHDPLRLCLYLPGSGEWEAHMRIDKTFVPWTATWLYYFEEWLESDDWKGGGEHPAPGEAETYNRRSRRSFRC